VPKPKPKPVDAEDSSERGYAVRVPSLFLSFFFLNDRARRNPIDRPGMTFNLFSFYFGAGLGIMRHRARRPRGGGGHPSHFVHLIGRR
jgi:hypothetical protein